jgi:2'-5' RNA ligase
MEQKINSYNFLNIYKDLNIDLKKLNCVMLDLNIDNSIKDIIATIDPNCFYASQNYPWINGCVGNSAHCTLLYGLLDNVKVEHCQEVLNGINLNELKIKEYSFFESPNEEEYYCIVAKLEVDSELLEAHKRLNFLPHINTFLDYMPHMTIAYIKKDEELKSKIIQALSKHKIKLLVEKISFNNNSKKPKIIKKII